MLCIVVVLPVVASTAMALHDGWTPVGDNATLALRSGDVLRGDPPLTGMPSTSNTISDQDISHPGPLEVWVASIPYALFGPAGLLVTVALVNALALVLSVVVGWRRGGPALAVAVTATGLILCWSLGTTIIRDPLNTHVPLLPWFALVLLAWDVRLGSWPSLPLAVFVASWVVQGHLAYVPLTATLVIGTALLCVVDHRARDAAARRRFARGRTPALFWSATIGILLSVPLLIDQVSGSGNLGRLLAFSGEGGQGARVGARAVIHALGAPPAWLREVNDPFLLLRGPSTFDLFAFAATVGLFAWVYAAARRRADTATLALLQAALLGLIGVAILVVRIPLGGAVLAADPMLLLRPVSAITWLAIGWGAWQVVAPSIVPNLTRTRVRGPAIVVGAIAVVVVVAATTVAPAKFGGYGEGLMEPGAELQPRVVAAVEGQPMVQVNATGWAARLYLRHAVIEDLERHGIATRTSDDDRVFRRAGGDRPAATATVWVVSDPAEPEQPAPGALLVGRTDIVRGGGLSGAAVRRHELRRKLDAAGRIELRDTGQISLSDVSREFFRWTTPPPDGQSLPSVWVSVDSFVELQANGLVVSPVIDDDLIAAIRRDTIGRFFAAEDTEAAVYVRFE
ncbi:hypothetical protein ACE2AJ_07450 [Aquihabitans daechungensis]|uniref:hypothetical protein n=1 Tax=Aquihabitans daechungensis TaxID=1052257 RepID=UPI003BA3D36F